MYYFNKETFIIVGYVDRCDALTLGHFVLRTQIDIIL